MMSRFETLLEELGAVFELKLHTDRKGACSIQVRPNLVVQLQPDPSQEALWIFTLVAETPAGKFREEIFKEALKANGLAGPRPGVFGYLQNTNQLTLSQKYPFDILNGERLSGLLGAFLELAEKWQEAIQQGRTSPPGAA